jgi:ABC-type sugar transport system substrate-binding protein
MKKITAFLLIALTVFSLCACSAGKAGTSPSPEPSASAPAVSAEASPSASAAASGTAAPASPSAAAASVELGYYDPNLDVNSRAPYKVVYMRTSTTALTQSFSDAFAQWSKRLNIEYKDYSANDDIDAYMNTLETLSSLNDGFILDVFNDQSSPRAVEICAENNIKWMSGMNRTLDGDGKLAHPTVGFDNEVFGEQMAEWLLDYAKKTWSGFDPQKAALISVDYSVIEQIHGRTVGAQKYWEKANPGAPFFSCDGIVGNLDSDTAYNLVAATMSAQPDIKYWLIASNTDAYAEGAARATEQVKKEDSTVITSIGGISLIDDWDAGYDGCWKSALYTANTLYTECIMNGLLVQLDGKAKPEELWPEWKSSGEKYAQLQIPSQILLKDNYREYLEWVDSYTGIDNANYDYNGTQFSAKGTPPSKS